MVKSLICCIEKNEENTRALVYIDGASFGNPGSAGIGIVVKDLDGSTIRTVSEYIGKTTNNVAEYTSLLRAMDIVNKLNIPYVTVYSDSELLVKQINGEYSVRDDKLKELYSRALGMIKKFKSFRIIHVDRNSNKEADRLAKMGASYRIE